MERSIAQAGNQLFPQISADPLALCTAAINWCWQQGMNGHDKFATCNQPRQQPGWVAEVPSSAGSRSCRKRGQGQHTLAGDLRFRIKPRQSANVWLSTADPCRQSRTCGRVARMHPNRSGIRSWRRMVDPRGPLRFCAASAGATTVQQSQWLF
jgi:hypothetical protein